MKSATAPSVKTKDAIEVCGGLKETARFFNVTNQAIWKWGDDLPPLRAYQIREAYPEIFKSVGNDAC